MLSSSANRDNKIRLRYRTFRCWRAHLFSLSIKALLELRCARRREHTRLARYMSYLVRAARHAGFELRRGLPFVAYVVVRSGIRVVPLPGMVPAKLSCIDVHDVYAAADLLKVCPVPTRTDTTACEIPILMYVVGRCRRNIGNFFVACLPEIGWSKPLEHLCAV